MTIDLCNVRTISNYGTLFSLLDTETRLPALDENFELFLRNFDAFECVTYFCVNDYDIICADDISGDVLWTDTTLEALDHLRAYYLEENQ